MSNIESKGLHPKFGLLKYKSMFDAEKCPLNGIPEVDTWIKEVFEISGMSEEEFNKRIKDTRTFVAYIFPECNDVNKYENLFKINLILFVIDDITEYADQSANRDVALMQEIAQQLNDSLDLIETNASPHQTNNWKPYTRGVYLIMKDIYTSYNQTLQKRFINYMREFFTELVIENETIQRYPSFSTKPKFETFEQLSKVRRIVSGSYWVFNLVEYENNLSFTDEEWNDPLWADMLERVADVLYTINDVYSFEKEFRDSRERLDKMANAVAVRVLLDNITIDRAMEDCIEYAVQKEKEFKQLSEQLIIKFKFRPDVKQFVRSVELLMGGNNQASSQIHRYKLL